MKSPAAISFQNATLAVEISDGHLVDVRDFHVRESLSALYEVQLEVVSRDPDLALEAVIGRPARFALVHPDGQGEMRAWQGILRSIEQVAIEDVDIGLSGYALTIVPSLWFLTQRRNHRIHQGKSEPQIAMQMLEEWGIEVDARLDLGAYPTREYRVQYGESDFHFLSRMLEDAGITYFFEEARMVLSDAPELAELSATLPYANRPTALSKAVATEVRLLRQVRPGRYTQRDIDHRRAPDFQVVASQADGLDPESRLERFHYTPGAFLFEQAGAEGTPVADDRGTHRADLSRGSEQVRRRLDAKRGSARVVELRLHEYLLAPGETLAISGHPRRDLAPEHHLLVVEATHQGSATDAWTHSIQARFTDIPFRPPIATRKPHVNGIESATVVGPSGEEIHVDEMGRIRVHFHWDRESQMNEHSSCWVPVSHPWGGAGYGAVNLPRIGQEVIVDFLGGDPDRPIVVGRVYTGVQQVPYTLPANKTQSGLKSFSSPATGGYNEMMFEDAAGREVLRIQAERNLNSLVKNDERTEVNNNSRRFIGRNELHSVGNDQWVHIGNHRRVSVGGSEARTIRGHLTQDTVEGSTIHRSTEPLLIESETQIVLKVGNSILKLLPHRADLLGDKVYINPPPVSPRLEAWRRYVTSLGIGNP